MKIAAFTPCHYGVDYLEYVLRSTQGFADQHMVLYTEHISRGYTRTDMHCPDSRHDLYRVAQKAGRRLMWVDDCQPDINSALALRPDVDILLLLDADEVIHQDLVDDIRRRYANGELTANQYRLPFVHHWRSFRYVCRNPGWPVRLFLPKNMNGQIDYWPEGDAQGNIHHFGYARSLTDMRYKMAVSIHHPEFRHDWWNDIFLRFPERLTDLHPVCRDGFWNAESFNLASLPQALGDHPWLNFEVIE